MSQERSKAYPGIDLSAAMERVKKFNDSLGSVGLHDRSEAAKGIGYTGITGTSGRTLGALVHYGLLDRVKDKYKLSELAKTILFSYSSEEERTQSIREAALNPSLFAEIYKEYKGSQLPGLLSNILTSGKYGIGAKVKDEVVEIYKATMSYAGILNGNQLVEFDEENDVTDESSSLVEDTVPTQDRGFQMDKPQGVSLGDTASGYDDLNKIEIVLREGVKAGIYAPYNLSDAEKNKLKSIIDLL